MEVVITTGFTEYRYGGGARLKQPEGEKGHTIELSDEYGALFFQRNKTKGIVTWNNEVHSASLKTMQCTYKLPFVGLHAVLQGALQLTADGLEGLVLEQRQYVFGSLRNIVATFTTKEGKIKSLHIHYPSYYLRDLTHYCPSFSILLYHNSGSLLNEHPTYIDEKFANVISDLVNNDFTGSIRKQYVYLKAMEVLFHVANRLLTDKERATAKEGVLLSTNEISELYKLASLLQENLHEKYTINQLSRKAGMSAGKLNKGFKQLFGVTIHQHIIKMQMNKANLLLTSTKLQISEIAEQTGFSSKHHFSNSYKKFFGKTPSEERI
jgi:AraC-like DNA-binding protein